MNRIDQKNQIRTILMQTFMSHTADSYPEAVDRIMAVFDVQKGYTNTAIKLARNVLEKHFGSVIGFDYFTDLAIDILDAVTGHVDFSVKMDNSADTFTPEPERHQLLGFQIIHEMTVDELLEEALAFQRGQWEKASKDILKKFVVEARMHQYKRRLVEEARFGTGDSW